MSSETTSSGTVSYTYDAADRPATLRVPGQSQVDYTYDVANRLTQIVQGGSTVSFSYDAANRRTSLTLPNGVVTSYGFDSASQLTGLTYSNGGTTLGALSYAYDLNGSRASVGGSYARTALPSAVATTVYNANNQLTTWGSASLTYDANGNLTNDGTHALAWDGRGQLTSIDSGSTASFAYDPFGRRQAKTVGATATTFVYDGINVVQEVIGANTANSLTGGIDEVFQRTDSAGPRSFIVDGLGSTVALADATPTLQTEYTYEPFGTSSTTGASTTNTSTFTGREDDGTGLYYYRARYYDPKAGRFISEDPIGFGGGDTNVYAYVFNAPTKWLDAFGLTVTNHTNQPITVKAEKGNNNFAVLAPGQTSGPSDGAIVGDKVIKHNTGVDITIGIDPTTGNLEVKYNTIIDRLIDTAVNLGKQGLGGDLSGIKDYDTWILAHPDWEDRLRPLYPHKEPVVCKP